MILYLANICSTLFAEQLLRMRLLEILPADLRRRDVRRDGQYRRPAAVGVEQPVDRVQVARPAAGCAHRQFPGQRGLRGRREPRGFLVSHMFPGDRAVPAQRTGEPVERVARIPYTRRTPTPSASPPSHQPPW